MPAYSPAARLLLLTEGPWDASRVAALRSDAGLPEDTVLLSVMPTDADEVAATLPSVLEQLPELEIAVLVGPLASETWRRQSSFQLHLTLIDAPDSAALAGAVRGAVAMLG